MFKTIRQVMIDAQAAHFRYFKIDNGPLHDIQALETMFPSDLLVEQYGKNVRSRGRLIFLLIP